MAEGFAKAMPDKELAAAKSCTILKPKATKQIHTTSFPTSSMSLLFLDKFPKFNIVIISTKINSNSKKKVAKGLNKNVPELFENISLTFSVEPKTNFSIAELKRALMQATNTAPSIIFLRDKPKHLILSQIVIGLSNVSKYNLYISMF